MTDLTIYEKALAAGASPEEAAAIQAGLAERGAELLAENEELRKLVSELSNALAMTDYMLGKYYLHYGVRGTFHPNPVTAQNIANLEVQRKVKEWVVFE